MIADNYIASFKNTETFKIISEGLLQGDIEKVLLGQNQYRTTSQYDMENTIPSQVLISMHILIQERKLLSANVNEVFKEISITSKVVCLLLGYLDVYLIYRKDHDELKLDYRNLLLRFKNKEFVYKELPCYRNLMTSIKSNLPESQS